jgi:predicted nucleotidyltransferase
MTVTRTDFLKILKVLAEEQVEFIVVGGVCAVLHGAPVTTFDLDLVHARDPENIQRLIKALQRLDARYRTADDRVLRPQTDRLKTGGHQLLLTTAGPLDLLGEIGAGRGFAELLDHVEECRLGPGLTVRLLKLEMLIRSKEEAAREKDHAVLAILRRTLAEKGKQE